MKATLDSVNEKSMEIAKTMKGARHIFFCGGNDLTEQIAKEGALKMKELTYMHCQSLRIDNIGFSFFGYLKKNPNTNIIFLVTDNMKNKLEFI